MNIPHPANAYLKFCHKAPFDVYVAIGYFSSSHDDWISEGWWKIGPGDSLKVVKGDLKNRYYYFYAEGGDAIWSGKYSFCTTEKSFRIIGSKNCKRRGYKIKRFDKIDTKSSKNHTLVLDYTFPTEPLSVGKGDYIGEGGANTSVTLYRNGFLTLSSEVWSDAKTEGVRAYVFVVFVDFKGRAIYVSNRFNLPTACGKWDPTCPDLRLVTNSQDLPEIVAKYTKQIDIYHGDRNTPDFWKQQVKNVKKAVNTYDDLPPEAKTAIQIGLMALLGG